MSTDLRIDEDDVILVRVSGETAARLRVLSDHCHADPVSVAASLLHDLLKDDEDAHFLLTAPVRGSKPN